MKLIRPACPTNINVLTQVSTEFALRHTAVFDQQTQMIREERGRLNQSLLELNGITPYPSEANFILIRRRKRAATELFEALKTQGVLVKNLHGAHPILDQCLHHGWHGAGKQCLYRSTEKGSLGPRNK